MLIHAYSKDFIFTVRLTVHTNPSRKRSPLKTLFKTPFSVLVQTESIFKAELSI